MPDWKQFVRERLHLPLAPTRAAEIADDLAQQLDEAYREALRRGASETEARAAAEQHIPDWHALAQDILRTERRNVGTARSSEIPHTASASGGSFFSGFGGDLRHGVRSLWKNPSFTLAVVVTLALGIGANVAIFSVADAVVFRSLPFPEPERLVVIHNEYEGKPANSSPPDYLDRREMARTLESVAAFAERQADLTGRGEPVRLNVMRATAGFWSVLGVNPLLGRTFTDAEDKPGANTVVVLSYQSWQQRFGGDAGILGASLTLNGVPRTVIGVMPRNFRPFSTNAEAFLPIAFRPGELADTFRGNEYLTVIARVRRGVGLRQVETEMDAIAASVLNRVPRRRDFLARVRWAASVVPMHEEVVGSSRPAILTVFSAVGLLLLMACVNVTNLLLARAAARRQEISTRIALGASAARLARLLFAETVVLSAAGGLAGLALAYAAVRVFAAAPITGVPRLEEVSLHWHSLAYTGIIVLSAALLCGLAPMRLLLRGDLSRSLKLRHDSTGRAPQLRMSRALVTAQLSMALLVLVGAGLLLRTFQNLTRVHPGFATEDRISFRILLPATRYPDDATRTAFIERLTDQLRAAPGVRQAGFTQRLPLDSLNDTATFRIYRGEEPPADAPPPSAELRTITPGWFEAMGIALREGRDFNARDTATSPPVAIVDERLAARHWPGRSPIGQRLSFGDTDWREVVGVVATIHNAGLDSPGKGDGQLYLVNTQNTQSTLFGVLAVANDAGNWRATIANTVQSLDAALPVDQVQPLSTQIASSIAPRKHVSSLLAIFAAVGLALAASGLYGLISYLVGQRRQEFAIRMAMGARPADVLRLVLRQGTRMVLQGLVLGSLAAFALARMIENQLFGVRPSDAATFAIAAVVLCAIALGAMAVPAIRATRVDPLSALRAE